MKKLIIDANKTNWKINFKELLKYKDLFITLAWRDFKVRYAQTTIGLLWAIIQPLVTLLILSLVFGNFIGIKTEVPHILFTIAGMSLWSYFSYVLVNSGNSIIASQDMVKKIYFPRLIIPLSKAVVGFVDFGVALVIMLVLMIYYGVVPSVNIFFAPLFILMGIVAALSVGIWLSALTIRYRDFQHVVPFIVQIGLYITPIAYPASFALKKLPNWASAIYYLNPMAGVVQGFRWSVFGGDSPDNLIFVSLGMTILLFILGLIYFSKVENEMADYI
jgi:lipopolysaccharide transport system permease protein